MRKQWITAMSAAIFAALCGGISDAADTTLGTVYVDADKDKKIIEPMAGDQVNTGYTGGILGEQKLQDVPFTVVSFTEKTIEEYSDPTQPLTSILANNPSVKSTGTTTYDDFSVRGLPLNGYEIMLNGIPGLFGQGTAPVNYLSRIDVTAGPAMAVNTAMAMESAGGLVNMISKKAEDKPVSDVTLGVSGKGTFTQQIDAGQRFGKNNEWGIRVNAMNSDGETAISDEKKMQRDIFVNIDHKDDKSSTNILVGYVKDRAENSLRWFTFGDDLTYVPGAPDISKNYSFKGMHWESDKWIATVNHEQKLNDNWSAFVNAGYGKYDSYDSVNSDWRYTIHEDGTFDDLIAIYPFAYDSRSFQFGFKGQVKTGDVTHHVVAAADRFWQKTYKGERWNATDVTGHNVVDDKGHIIIGGNLHDGITVQPDVIPGYSYPAASLKSKSVYTSWKLVDTMEIGKFNVLAGVIKQQVSNQSVGSAAEKSDAVSPLYGLVYKANDQLSLYASHSESFSKGSVVDSDYANAGEILSPAKTKQNEVGVKYNNGKIMSGLSFFQIKTAGSLENVIDGKKYLSNDARTEYKGFDWSVYGKLSNKWNIMGGLMYVDSKYTRASVDRKGNQPQGHQVNGVPEWTGTIGLEYNANEKASFLARARYSGSYTIKYDKYRLPSYWMVDVGAKYTTQLHHTPVTFSAMVYNLFDKAAWEPLAGGDNLILSMPRSYILSATLHF